MQFRVAASLVELVQGDIVRQDVEAIVNAANSSLIRGGGVDGAIHRAAGPELQAECLKLGGCPTGEARITPGYRLAARFIIHAVGPVYSRSSRDAELLASCYRNSLQLAERHGLKSLALPAISTGVYGYPLEEAAAVSLAAVKQHLDAGTAIELVRFVLFDRAALTAFESAAQDVFGGAAGAR